MLRYLLIIGILSGSTEAASDVNWASIPRSVITKKENEIWVVVADTGVDYTHKMLIGSTLYDPSRDRDYSDPHGHGTHIAGLVLYGDIRGGNENTVCPEVKIISCRYYNLDKSPNSNLEYSIDCVKYATRIKADYFNYSGGGVDFSINEYMAYSKYIEGGGSVFAAAGNERSDLTIRSYYPASYALPNGTNGLPTLPINFVMNVDGNGNRHSTSNYHDLAIKEQGTDVQSALPNNKYGLMTGTSQSTAIALHTKLIQRCKEIKNKVTKSHEIKDNPSVDKTLRGKHGQKVKRHKSSKVRTHSN